MEAASQLVDEVFELAYSVVYAHYLEEQAVPYTVSQAKHSLLQIIEASCCTSVVLLYFHCTYMYTCTCRSVGMCNVNLLQWQFLTRDEGERDTLNDPSWTQDEGTKWNNCTACSCILFSYCYLYTCTMYLFISVCVCVCVQSQWPV